MMKKLFDKILENIKLIPDLRDKQNYDFNKFNKLIEKCYSVEIINDKICNTIKIDDILNNKLSNNRDKFTQLISNRYNHLNKFFCYDIEIFEKSNGYQKRLLCCRKFFETSFIILLNEVLDKTTISRKYRNYLYKNIYLYQLIDYQKLGYSKIPSHRFKTTNEKNMVIPEKNILNEIELIQKHISEYQYNKEYLTPEQKQILMDTYKHWWNKYQEYIDNNYPKINNRFKYYNGVKIKIIISKTITPDKFCDTGLALCVGMSENENNHIKIIFENDIKRIVFMDDEYNDYDDVSISWSFDLNDLDNSIDMVDSSIKFEVNRQLINIFKSSIELDGYILLIKLLLEYSGYKCSEVQSKGLFVSKNINVSKDNLDDIVIIKDDIITQNKDKYKIKVVNTLDKKYINKFTDDLDKNYQYLIFSLSVISSKFKKRLKKIKKRHFFDIDDIFDFINRKIVSSDLFEDILLKNLVYPYLEKRVGDLKSGANILRGKKLKERLLNCPIGHKGWRKFEEITKDILEFLFKDSFNNFRLKEQCRNISGTDRRDFILLNTGNHEFWQNLKNFYNCSSIIIESKNIKTKVKNDELRQVSDYLEKEAIGKFGIIFSRKGLSEGGEKKQIEYLTNTSKKLILVLSEEDIIDLIRKKANNESPEDLLQEIKFDIETKL